MKMSYLSTAIICTAFLFLSGCFGREENITLDEHGNTHIHVSFEGNIDQYPPVFELPNEGSWKIVEQEIKDTEAGGIELKISAEMNIPYGKDLPDRYNLNDSTSQGLRFPTTVKTYTKDDRTFFEFTRRYQPRKYMPYEIYYEQVDKELEEEIFEKGIFNVSQQKRDAYLNQLTPALHSSQLRTFYDVLGIMVLHNYISQDTRRQLLKSAGDKIGETFTREKLKEILAGIDEKTTTNDMDQITNDMDQIFISIFKTHIRPEDGGLLDAFAKLLENERRTRTVTDAIGGHEFSIKLKMPGQIVVTNGIFSEDSLGTVSWEFLSSTLNDCEYILHAVSVVDN